MPYKDPEVRKIKAREYGKKWYQKNKITHKLNTYKNKKKYNRKKLKQQDYGNDEKESRL